LGVAYSKSELIQVAIFGFVFLGDRVSGVVAIAIALGTAGVLMLAPANRTSSAGIAGGLDFAYRLARHRLRRGIRTFRGRISRRRPHAPGYALPDGFCLHTADRS